VVENGQLNIRKVLTANDPRDFPNVNIANTGAIKLGKTGDKLAPINYITI